MGPTIHQERSATSAILAHRCEHLNLEVWDLKGLSAPWFLLPTRLSGLKGNRDRGVITSLFTEGVCDMPMDPHQGADIGELSPYPLSDDI